MQIRWIRTVLLTLCVSLPVVGALATGTPVLAQGGATTERASVASDGTQGNKWSGFWGNGLAISGDGRYVAFGSDASNLVPGDTNGESDVFVYDRQTRQTTCVSVSPSGVPGDNYSYDPAVSADGRYVAFFSAASNLVPGGTDNSFDVFVRDRQTGQTTRGSVADNGAQG
jgi:Tol biopolymer transport system component